jgi:hypothetical protein
MTTQSGNQGPSTRQDKPENKHPIIFYWLTGGAATIAAAVITTLIAMLATHQSPGPVNPSPGAGNQSSTFASTTVSQVTPTQPATSTTVSQVTATQPAARTITGSWSQQSGQLTLVISEVDRQGSMIQLHVKAINGSAAAMDLPLYGYFVATDNNGETYTSEIDNSNWATSVPANGFITGIVVLSGAPSASARTLKVSFTTVFGEYAPNGGITVSGIPIPK